MLWFLADKYNDAKEAAWPSIANIAKHVGLSRRRVREIIAALICRGVLVRSKRTRQDGSTTSNNYRFYELNDNVAPSCPPSTGPPPQFGRNCDKEGSDPQQLPGNSAVRSSGDPCQPKNLKGTQSESTIDTEKEIGKEVFPPTPQAGGLSRLAGQKPLALRSDDDAWRLVLVDLKSQFSTVAGVTSLPDEYDRYFRDTWEITVEDGHRIRIGAIDPASARLGLRKYARRVRDTVKKFFGVEAEIVVDDSPVAPCAEIPEAN